MLFRKMLRDIGAGKAQFIAIFLMIFLGVFIYAGVNSDWNGMKTSAEQFYEETTLSDVWVYGNGFSQKDVALLRETEGIDLVERRASMNTFVTGDKKKQITLFMPEDHILSQMKVIHGENYSAESDGIWIDQSYAEENELTLGQDYTLQMGGIVIEKKIKGFVLHPEMVYQSGNDTLLPDYANQGYAFLSAKHVSSMDKIPYTQLLLKTDTPDKMESVVSDVLEKSNLTFVRKEDMISYATLQSEIEQHQAFSNVFPIVFLLIAVLTTMTTLSKLIMNQRLQIGILMALGFSNRKITVHYLSHVLTIASLGAAFGFLIGPLVIPKLLFPMMRSLYSLPQLTAVPVTGSIYMVFFSVFICFVVAILICQKQLQEKPAVALRPAAIVYRKEKKHSGALFSSLNFYAQWNARDIFRNKIRSLIAVIGVAGCMGLMVCAFSMQNSMDHMMNMMFSELSTYEMRVGLDPTADGEQLREKMDGSLIMEAAIELELINSHMDISEKKTGSLLVQEDTRYLKMQNEQHKEVALPSDGIALSYNIAASYGIKRGDYISWRIMGNKGFVKHKVSQIIHTPSSQGITMSKEVFEDADFPFIPTAIVGKSAMVESLAGVTSIQYLKGDIDKSMDTMMEGMNLLIGILIFGAVLLGLVVLYNIGTLSYYEKIREMATLQVLGFRNQQVKKLLAQQNIWLSLIGILLGIPFGYVLIYTIVSTIGSSMDMQIVIQPITLAGCCLSTLLVSHLILKIVSCKVKKIDMVSALKAME